MQNAIQEFKQSSIVFEKRGILSQNLKTSNMKFKNELQISCSSMFFAWTSHRFSTYDCLKRVCGIFWIYLDLELFAKIEKNLVSVHSFFTLLLITQDLSKIKKIPHTLL